MEVDTQPASSHKDQNVIEIPARDDETIVLDLSSLPPVEDIVDFLSGERAPLTYWLKIARHYVHTNELEEALKVLTHPQLDRDHELTRDNQHDRNLLELILLRGSLLHFTATRRPFTGERKERLDMLERASNDVQRAKIAASRIGAPDTRILLLEAFLDLASKKADTSWSKLELVLAQDPDNVPARLGQAAIYFGKKKYSQALELYRLVMRLCDAPANVRIGLGVTLARLGHDEKAELSFLRAIELDPSNVCGLVGLAVLAENKQEADSIREAVKHLKRAYQIDKASPMVLNHLTNHFLHRKDLDKAFSFANHALRNSQVDEMRAESLYYLGRVAHIKGDMDEAFRYYYQAAKISPEFPLPHFGLGQMYIHRKDTANAIKCFKEVVRLNPDNYDALKVLGTLCAHSPSDTLRNDALGYLRRVTDKHPGDVDAWIELALLQEKNNPEESLEVYEEALALLSSKEGVEVPFELRNNLASLRIQLGNAQGALELLNAAVEELEQTLEGAIEDSEDATYYRSMLVTLRYNRGLAYEALSEFDKAVAEYTSLKEEHPTYTDAVLRLASIAAGRGHVEQAHDMLRSVLRSTKDTRAWAMRANLYFNSGQLDAALKLYEELYGKRSRDEYALVAMGNIFLAREDPERALHTYRKALACARSNAFAAHGCACALAQTGQFGVARDVLLQVREATTAPGTLEDSLINLAHIYVEQGMLQEAVQLYTKYLRTDSQFKERAQVLTYLARALYKQKKYALARRHLMQAMHVNPSETRTIFNIGLTKLAQAKMLLESHDLAVEDTETIRSLLNSGSEVFDRLSKAKGKLKYDPNEAKKQYQACRDLILQVGNLDQRLAKQREREQELEQRRKAVKERIAAAQQERVAAKQRLQQEEEERRKSMLQSFDQEKGSSVQIEEVKPAAPKSSGGRSRSKKSKTDDNFIADEDEDDDMEDAKQPTVGSDAEDGDTQSTRVKRKKGGSARKRTKRLKRDSASEGDSDDDDFFEKREKTRKEAPGKYKSAARIDTDDEDDGNDDGEDKASDAANYDDDPEDANPQ